MSKLSEIFSTECSVKYMNTMLYQGNNNIHGCSGNYTSRLNILFNTSKRKHPSFLHSYHIEILL